MNLAELRKRIAEVLGVSTSQDQLAYEVFTECVSEILAEGITLKVPRVGFFQIKTANPKTKRPLQLLFSTLPEDYTKEARTLYLTIDVYPRIKNPIDFDSQVFSIGVGKPLLPLMDDEHDSETSFALLRKSVEERVKELIAESDQIPNFNLWEDSFPNTDDELETKTDLKTQLSELTQDYQISPSNNLDEKETTEDFLNLLLAQNNFQITDDFSTDIKENADLPDPHGSDIVPSFDDELFNVQSDFSSPETSIDELLEDVTPAVSNDNIILESSEIIAASDEEIIVDGDEGVMFGEILTEEFKNIEEDEQLKISDLLAGEETFKDEDEEIGVEHPTSTKYLLFDQPAEENIVSDSTRQWNIEHEHLQEIVQAELQEYDGEKIADENSRVLNQLLAEPTPEVSNKVDQVIPPEIPVQLVSENPVIEKMVGDEDVDQEEKSNLKIEWSWGDELKEEFGIGINDEIENELSNADDYNSEIKEEIKSDKNEREQNKEPDVVADFVNKYTSELEAKQPEEFNLRKTRIDLFTRLEKTLEKEITFLKEELEKPKPEEIHEEITFSKLVTDVRETPKIAFKDENVFLDFKTPPPKYEFYEEKQEPILTKPKRITILLSPDEPEQNVSSAVKEPAPLSDERATSGKKYFGKAFAVILLTFVISTALVIYFIFSNKKSDSFKTSDNKPTIEQKKEQVDGQVYKNTIIEPSKDDVTSLNVDDFSDFPRTATPPVPIKQGADLSTLNTRAENLVNRKVENYQNKSEPAKQIPSEELTSQKNDLYKSVQSDIRVNNMIFSDGKTFNFQHSSWRRKDLAEREVIRLRDLGFNAFLIEAYLPEKGGNWYRVRIGSFKTEQEAASFKAKNNF